jgi:hypothetical protein
MSVSYGGSSITFEDGSIVSSGSQGFKNKIINGAMMINQRGGTVTTDNTYCLDRYLFRETTDGSASVQQSSIAPTDFINSLLFTVTGTDSSLSTNQYAAIQQRIEGLNIVDLNWGTANAKTVTLSFWVRSSVTGTFGASLSNSAGDRSYPFSYTINSADTWEKETITIPGDTTGTWLTTSGIGIQLNLSMAAASNLLGTANTWASAFYIGTTGDTNLHATNGATFYISGVQLEKGTTASSFEFRSYGKELMLCQRYLPYWKFDGSSQVFTNSFVMSTTVSGVFSVTSPVPTRVAPTGLVVSSASHFAASEGDSGVTFSAFSLHSGSYTGLSVTWGSGTAKTAFRPIVVYNTSTSAFFYGTGCEL